MLFYNLTPVFISLPSKITEHSVLVLERQYCTSEVSSLTGDFPPKLGNVLFCSGVEVFLSDREEDVYLDRVGVPYMFSEIELSSTDLSV